MGRFIITTLFIVSNWIVSSSGKSCAWLGIPWCGVFSTCGSNSHQMRFGFSHSTCILQFTRYCCPLGNGFNVILCENDQFNGDCETTTIPQNDFCADIDKQDWASSINTLGQCVRLYREKNCMGRTKAYYVGSPGHDNLGDFNDIARSVGKCYSHDHSQKDCDRAKRQAISQPGSGGGGCRFARDELFIGFLILLPILRRNNNNDPIVGVQLGGRGEVLSVEARIQQHHLGTGTPTNQAARDFARGLGNSNDDAGHIIAARLGGSGTDLQNIFPQSPNINRGVWAQMESAIADFVQRGATARVNINLVYDVNSTRPTQIVYRVMDDQTGHIIFFDDLVNP